MTGTAATWFVLALTGFYRCYTRGPLYGVMTYMFVYFIAPLGRVYWWAYAIPNLRWSLSSFLVLITGCLFQPKKLSRIRIGDIGPGKWLVAFLLLSVCVSFFAIRPDKSFERCYDFMRYVLIYYMIVKCIKEEKQFEWITLLILLCGFFMGYTAKNKPRHGGRLENVGVPDAFDSNGFALLLATMVPFAFPALLSNNKYLKWCTVPCAAFIVNAIVLCNSRGGMLSLIVIFISFVFFTNVAKFRKLLLILGMVGICGFLFLADNTFWDRFSTVKDSAGEDRGSGRLDIWLEGLQMVKDYPMGTGGLGFKALSPIYISNLTAGGIRGPHNTYLLILVEQGPLGLVIYLCLNIHVFWLLRKARKIIIKNEGRKKMSRSSGGELYLYLLNVAITASLAGHSFGAIFGSRVYYEYYYYMLGIATSLYYVTRDKYAARRRQLAG